MINSWIVSLALYIQINFRPFDLINIKVFADVIITNIFQDIFPPVSQTDQKFQKIDIQKSDLEITIKFLNFRTAEDFAVICLKFKDSLRVVCQKMQMEKRKVKTLIRLLL